MRIIGLDLGSSSVKAVEIDSAFGRYEIHEYHETSVATGERPAAAAARLIESLPKKPDRISVSLPSQLVTQRTLLIPSRDRKAIRAAIAFELEDDLPFEMDQCNYDYSVLSQSSQGSLVHIAISLKKHITDFLAELTQYGIEPDLITSDSWAFRCYMNRIITRTSQQGPVLLVHIGYRQTQFYVHNEGAPLVFHAMDWGGNDLTLAIAADLKLDVTQAEQAKQERGLRTPLNESDEAIECRGEILQNLQKLLTEMRQIVLTTRNLTRQPPTVVYMCGGGSLVTGLNELFSQELHLPVQPLQGLSALSLSGVSYSEETDAKFLKAFSLGLCLVGADRSAAINLSKGLLGKGRTAQSLDWKVLRRPVLATAAVVTCLALSLICETIAYKSKLKFEDVRLEKSMRAFLPGLSPSAARTYLASPSKLKEAVKKELDSQRELATLYSPNPRSPMLFLKNLSAQVPSGVVVDMTNIHAGAAAETPYKPDAATDASLTFVVSNAQTIDKLNDALSKVLTGIQKTQPEEVQAPDGSGKKLSVTFTGKPREDAYGK